MPPGARSVLDLSQTPLENPLSSLARCVEQSFAPGGALSRTEADFRPRPGQLRMALAVARTIEQGGVLVVEAGTGVGKTFSYLVPTLLSGEKVLLSTATKALQDQLHARDLPRLVQALGLPVRTALLKGRGSYLCLHRLEQARQHSAVHDGSVAQTLARIELWAQTTRSGDLAELPALDERSAAIPLATSTRDNCLGSQCPQFRQCHVLQARREALEADIVVINHHLFFADSAVRESGMAELLPTVRVVVFDEAHQLNETGVLFLGRQLGTGQLLDFARDLLAVGLQRARGMADWQGLGVQMERAARDLRCRPQLGRHPSRPCTRGGNNQVHSTSTPPFRTSKARSLSAPRASEPLALAHASRDVVPPTPRGIQPGGRTTDCGWRRPA